jgi:hypothetical protein
MKKKDAAVANGAIAAPSFSEQAIKQSGRSFTSHD